MTDFLGNTTELTGLDGLFIDFYGTIADGDRAIVEHACRRLVDHFNLPMTAPELATLWGRPFFKAIETHNGDNFLTLFECECVSLVETLGPIVGWFDPEPFVRELQTYWRLPPLHAEAREVLAALPLPVCCVSNVDREDMEHAARHHRLDFACIVTSQDARSYKPDPGIFRFALKRTGWRADRVLHVGDSLHSDVLGAQRAGIAAVWVNRPDRIFDIGEAHPHHTIHDLTGLADLCAAYA